MLGFSMQAAAQFHGVAVATACESPSKVGETVSCSARFRNEDDFGDTHRVNEFWGVIDPLGLNIRVPLVGSAPIIAVSAGTVCTPAPVSESAPLGLVFPCDVPSDGDELTPDDFVTIGDSFEIPDVGSDLLQVQARVIEQDLCDDPDTAGCSTLLNQQEQPAAVNLFSPSLEVTKNGPPAAKVGDEITYSIGFTNTSTGASFPGFESCTGSDTILGDLGAFDPAGETRNFLYTVMAGDPNPLANTATITCGVIGFDNIVEDSDDHSLDWIAPAVSLTKECRPDPVLVGEEITWAVTVENTGNANLDCQLTDPVADINESFLLAPAGSESFNNSRIVAPEDFPLLSNTASVVCDVVGFQNQVNDSDSADCAVENPGEEICRTPGFWGTHAGTEHRRATNLTQMVIDAGGPLLVCGQTIDNTDVGNMMSAVEAMCVSIEGFQQRQLARQLTAMALNCIVSGGGADCSGTSVEGLFADANASCTADDAQVSFWIERVDCFNNGGQYDEVAGECLIDDLDPNNCQNRELDESTNIFDGIRPLPGPAGSPNACSSANGNGVKVVPAV